MRTTSDVLKSQLSSDFIYEDILRNLELTNALCGSQRPFLKSTIVVDKKQYNHAGLSYNQTYRIKKKKDVS